MATTSSDREQATTGLRSNALATSLRTPLKRYARLLGADSTLADDLVQEAFLIALRRDTFDASTPGAAFTFLRTTVRHLWLQRHRGRVPQCDIDEADRVWEERCHDGGDSYVEALRACVERLPERSRRLLTSTYVNDAERTTPEATFGMGKDGIKSALRRLRTFLHDCIQRRVRREEA